MVDTRPHFLPPHLIVRVCSCIYTFLVMFRYGKFAVLDLLDIEDAYTALNVKFEEVKKDLLSDLMSKKLMLDDK